MRIAKRPVRGVTLIELLVAVTLVGLLSVGILYSMHAGLLTLHRTGDRMLAHRRVLGAQRAIDQQLRNVVPVRISCGGAPPGLFFDGNASSMRLVSEYSIEEAHRGYPRLAEYLVIPGGGNRGVRLVVNELHYTGPGALTPLCTGVVPDALAQVLRPTFQPVTLRPRAFVLADRLAYCRISYLIHHVQGRRKFWSAQFAGGSPPEAVRIEMAPLEGAPAGLQMGTMTVPMRVTRLAQEYVDVEQ